jgi:hypothetical protein
MIYSEQNLAAIEKLIHDDPHFKKTREKIKIALDKNPKRITLAEARAQIEKFKKCNT